jgi:nucleotide-binding universal stress UspA family protein
MILISYDGSDDAKAAIDRAGALFAGQQATVLTVWEPFIDVLARSGAGLGFGTMAFDANDVDAASELAANEAANEGVQRAKAAGLDAQPRVAARGATIHGTIIEVAQDVGADAIVMGTRGLSRLKSVFLGSVSNGVLHHADRPVVVIPSEETAAERAQRLP